MTNFHLENAKFDYEPFPICYIPNFIDPDIYKEMSENFPDIGLFSEGGYAGIKYTLSELENSDKYYKFLADNPVWKEFFETVKRREFVEQTLGFLRDHHIDLRVGKYRFSKNVHKKNNRFSNLLSKKNTLKTKFEFSVLPANEGQVIPHTDKPSKIITLVLSFMKPGEWKEEWGGGTEVILPKDRTRIYNYNNLQMPFEDVEVLKTFPFEPNQCILFIKTYNSWHSVHPIKGPENMLRKTVTINIESLRH